jgi:hypothetical protein
MAAEAFLDALDELLEWWSGNKVVQVNTLATTTCGPRYCGVAPIAVWSQGRRYQTASRLQHERR